MGWNCTRAASEAMDKVERACKATRQADTSSNVYHANGKRYFYETTRRVQSDGGVSGSIWLCVGEHHARKVGTFRIDGRGNVVRGPKLFREAAAIS